ncbi:MAG: tRNA (adenosine(37)-N6)-dimethylallyltransferase MiaA [Bacteroidales bacterium]|jgi:tRNA dimethylallyltransferase|nr:tRNA (adenosine(37)-N6)-dimethylallyltransferase MiaA [Bacteroidales bacterium]
MNLFPIPEIENAFDHHRPLLCVITGPTAVGKTDITIQCAEQYNIPIISADSRQFYKEMSIGTAKPSMDELARAKHYFIGNISITDYYSVYRYQEEVLELLPKLFDQSPVVILTGGSGLFIDAVCNGIDELPDPDLEIRNNLIKLYETEGIESLRHQLKLVDPKFYETTDISNYKRLMRALEVSLQTGKPYSEQLTASTRNHTFDICKYCLTRPRQELNDRINLRTDIMLEQGLLEEATALYSFRQFNALNTVGYKELFDFIDHKLTLEQAITDIKTHTRRYAKRQMTWFKRDGNYKMIALSIEKSTSHLFD